MQILESFICGKENNPSTCEDGIFIGEHLVAVIDGVTAKGNRLWNGHKSGYYAKELSLSYLQQEGVEQQTAEELFTNLDAVLQKNIALQGTKPAIEEYPRASIIVYNDIYKEIWSYGDCQCSLNGKVYDHSKKIDELNENLRAYYLEYHLQKGMTLEELKKNDLGRAAIGESLLMQFTFENKPGEFGYPVLNGMGIEKAMIKSYKVKSGDELVLASDGYPVLGRNLQESEANLNDILQEDPMCFRRFRCTKGLKEGNVSFDDRAFCRILV